MLRVNHRALPKVWRDIEIAADQTLEDLHLMIQQVFDWNDDHLYSFFMNGRAHDQASEIGSPWSETARHTQQVTLGSLDLAPHARFLYYFDYGDSHEFDVQVRQINPAAPQGNYPCLVAQHGQAPPQYPDLDEETGEMEWDSYAFGAAESPLDDMKQSSRKELHRIWQAAQAGQPLRGEEAMLAEIMHEHTEWHPIWDHLNTISDAELEQVFRVDLTRAAHFVKPPIVQSFNGGTAHAGYGRADRDSPRGPQRSPQEATSACWSAIRLFHQPPDGASPAPRRRTCEFSIAPIRQRVQWLPASSPTMYPLSATAPSFPECGDPVVDPQVEVGRIGQTPQDLRVVPEEIAKTGKEVPVSEHQHHHPSFRRDLQVARITHVNLGQLARQIPKVFHQAQGRAHALAPHALAVVAPDAGQHRQRESGAIRLNQKRSLRVDQRDFIRRHTRRCRQLNEGHGLALHNPHGPAGPATTRETTASFTQSIAIRLRRRSASGSKYRLRP